MNLTEWCSWYNEILEVFGFDRRADEESAEVLHDILGDKGLTPGEITIGRNVIVFGAGPSLDENILEFKKYLDPNEFTLICADGAVTALLSEDVVPNIVVTDLDGKIDDILDSNKRGSIMVVHAHGNNMENIKRYVPSLKNVLGTTQSLPLNNVYNFGGFTDGDRCLFIANELGAENIILAGMDFGKIITRYSRPEIKNETGNADTVKEKKLEYAKKLVEWIAENENVNIFNASHGEKIDGVENLKFSDFPK